jgi:hypothetical protein
VFELKYPPEATKDSDDEDEKKEKKDQEGGEKNANAE